jgi:glycosyltransferase involved in cell wall biosynthesis
MAIAVFSSTIDPRDGYGNITKEYCTALHEQGQSFTLFLPRSQEHIVRGNSFPFAIRCVLPEYIFRIFQPKGLSYFCATDVSQYSIVHSLFAFPYCIHAAVSAAKYRKPFMMGAQGTHGVRPLTYVPEKFLMKWCYGRAVAITTPSRFTRDRIFEYARRTYPITVIHNGVKFERFQRPLDVSILKEKYNGKRVLLTVGGLWGRKGHDLVIRALADILKQRQDVVYVIVGDGKGKADLEELARRHSVATAVEFVGLQSGDDLVRYFQLCDVYVHTPKVIDLKFEGFGIVYLEASACGKPIVATDAGGVRDAVIDGKTGTVVPDGDIEGVAHAILSFLQNPEKAAEFGANGRVYAQENDWKFVAEQYVRLYHQIYEDPHYRGCGFHRGERGRVLP